MIFLDKSLCRTFVFVGQWLHAFLFSNMNLCQFSILHNEVENALFITMYYMNVHRLMLVGIEIEDEPKILEYLWHKSVY